jgi:hypothetical protein
VDVAGGAEQRLLEVLATQDDDPAASMRKQAAPRVSSCPTDSKGQPRMATSSIAAAVAVVALADLLEVLRTRLGPVSSRFGYAFGPGDVAFVDDAGAVRVGRDLLAAGDVAVPVVRGEFLRAEEPRWAVSSW